MLEVAILAMAILMAGALVVLVYMAGSNTEKTNAAQPTLEGSGATKKPRAMGSGDD